MELLEYKRGRDVLQIGHLQDAVKALAEADEEGSGMKEAEARVGCKPR